MLPVQEVAYIDMIANWSWRAIHATCDLTTWASWAPGHLLKVVKTNCDVTNRVSVCVCVMKTEIISCPLDTNPTCSFKVRWAEPLCPMMRQEQEKQDGEKPIKVLQSSKLLTSFFSCLIIIKKKPTNFATLRRQKQQTPLSHQMPAPLPREPRRCRRRYLAALADLPPAFFINPFSNISFSHKSCRRRWSENLFSSQGFFPSFVLSLISFFLSRFFLKTGLQRPRPIKTSRRLCIFSICAVFFSSSFCPILPGCDFISKQPHRREKLPDNVQRRDTSLASLFCSRSPSSSPPPPVVLHLTNFFFLLLAFIVVMQAERWRSRVSAWLQEPRPLMLPGAGWGSAYFLTGELIFFFFWRGGVD